MTGWRVNAEDPRTTDELIRVALAELDLADEDCRSSTSAVVSLHFRPTREVLERAVELCRSAVGDERRLGVLILGELRELEDVSAANPAFVEESMEVLLELAGSEQETDVLAELARAFGYRRDPRGVQALLGWRTHPEQPVRFFVACSLRKCRAEDNEEQVVAALIGLTNDENGAVRDYALFGLRELEVDGTEIRDAMLRCVGDPDSSVAGEALVGLALLGDKRGIEPLKEYLRDASPRRVLCYGLEAATAHADPSLLPALRALEESHGEWLGIAEAIQACTDRRPWCTADRR